MINNKMIDAEQSKYEHLDFGCAHLTAHDFVQCRDELSGIVVAPFDQSKAKGVGYNFSLSEMIYSLKRKRLVPICRDAHETYFYLRPHETVLALSYEYLKVDNYIAGSFHSRVRMNADGIGSTSTTLDPGWKGMLLFTLNNPMHRKIKVVLSPREDGVVQQHSVVTLVAWRTKNPGSKKDGDPDRQLSLHLDNPAMRIDIWSDLTAKPLRLFRNKEYQRFSSLVNSLSPVETKPLQNAGWTEELKKTLTELNVAVETRNDAHAIRAALIRIQNIENLPDTLSTRLNKLTACLEENVDGNPFSLEEHCSKPEYRKLIELSKREIQYLELSEQICQIHALISSQVPTAWRKNTLPYLWHLFKKNLGVILSVVYFFFLVRFGQINIHPDFWKDLVLGFMPILVSVITVILFDRK